MIPHITTGTFTESNNAEDAQSYLLANEFIEDQIVMNGLTMQVYTLTSIEAQEAVDVLRNYGAENIGMVETK